MKRCDSCKHSVFYEEGNYLMVGCEIKKELTELIARGLMTELAGLEEDCMLWESEEERRMVH